MRQWVAGIPLSSARSALGRISMTGGTLVLTDQDVTFTPLTLFGRTHRFALGDVTGVTAYADRPPRLRITTSDGRSLVLLTAPERTTAVWSRDSSARDAAVAAISARLSAAEASAPER